MLFYDIVNAVAKVHPLVPETAVQRAWQNGRRLHGKAYGLADVLRDLEYATA